MVKRAQRAMLLLRVLRASVVNLLFAYSRQARKVGM